jgi:hypothetical protein
VNAELVAAALGGAGPAAGLRVIAVDGRSGSGKSTLATGLAAQLGADLLRMDDIYPGWDGLEAGIARLALGVLGPLSTGRPAGYRRWAWDRSATGAWQPVPAPATLVVEGVGCGARACARYLAALVWLEAPEPVRYARAIARDGEGYRPHWQRWAGQEDAYLARDRTPDRADLVVDTGGESGVTRGPGAQYGH